MKQPFRYFRGEFANSKYLYSLLTCPNFAMQDVLDEFVYQILFQWKLEDEISEGEMAVRDEDLIGIAQIAGLFTPVINALSSYGSIYFTPSKIVNERERSERGLFDMQNEQFKFVRLEMDDYPDDIVNEATNELCIGFVPHGTKPLGYLPYGAALFTETGELIRENLLPEPPQDGTPYTAFYGERFLSHEIFFKQDTFLTVDIFKLLFECIQHIRYNGPTITGFLKATEILGAGYIYNIEVISQGRYYKVFYQVNDSMDISNKDQRLAVWLGICAWKFKLFELELRQYLGG
jgi:hypothetical protein